MIRFVNDAKNGQELYITGDIIDDDEGTWIGEIWPEMAEAYNWPAGIKKQLDTMDKAKPLTVYINSSGGSVPAGVAISNMIARWKAPVTCVVDGWACSIATQIFFAGSIRKIPTNAYLMIHKPSGGMMGNAEDFRKMADTLDTLQEGLESTYRKASKDLKDEDIHRMVEEETWLTGEEVCDHFNVEPTEPVKAVAKWGSAKNLLKNIPQAILLAKEPEKQAVPPAGLKPEPKAGHAVEKAQKAIDAAMLRANQALVKAAMNAAERAEHA